MNIKHPIRAFIDALFWPAFFLALIQFAAPASLAKVNDLAGVVHSLGSQYGSGPQIQITPLDAYARGN